MAEACGPPCALDLSLLIPHPQIMFTRFLIGLDGSPQSAVALAQAITIGERFNSTLVLARVVRPDRLDEQLIRSLGAPWREGRPMPLPPDRAVLEQAAAQLLEEEAGAVRRAGLPVETAVRTGDVATELQSLAGQVDLVFVGRIGVGAGPDPLGPDARGVIRKAPVPVIVCGSVVSPMDHVAVAYDGEAGGMQALALAARFAQVTGARLEVIHAAKEEHQGGEVLARASMALSEFPLRFETHLCRGDVEDATAQAVRRLGCNALFAGAHREDRQVLVPSHTEGILRATDIPVLVHPESAGMSARLSASYRRSSS